MMLPILLGAMALIAVAILGWPLVRRTRRAPPRADFERAVFADQLAEIERDRERGLIGAEEAAAARTEIERRALASLGADAEATPAPARSRAGRALAVGLVVALPGLAGLAYFAVGRPGLPDQPFAERTQRTQLTEAQKRAGMETMTRMLRQQLEKDPNSPQGWALLARVYRRLGHDAEADQAFHKAMDVAGNPQVAAAIAISYGEALVGAADGVVTAPAKAAFDEALKADPGNPGAQFYHGLWLLQSGDAKTALAIWVRLEREAPKDAPYLDMLRARIAQVAKDFKLDPKAVAP